MSVYTPVGRDELAAWLQPLALGELIDEPEKVVEAIFKHYEARPFGPLPNEHEMMLNL